MALTDENNGTGMVMPVAPMSGFGGSMPYPVPMYGMGGGMGNGMNGENGWWLILVIIIIAALGGNWGNNNNGGSFGGGQPIIVNDGGNGVQRGFDQAAVMSGLTSLQSGISNLSTQLCSCCCDMQGTVNNGFYNVQNALCNGFNGVEQAANARQVADMQQAFAAQTAMAQGFNGIQSQLAQCCCDNRLATETLRATVLSENCADRFEAANNTRDIIDSQTRGTQAIIDKLCQLELDAKNDRISDLERQLTAANLSASQIAQTAQIQRGQVAEVDALYQRLRDCPVPTMPVYGMQPIFTCPTNNNGCGCGCGNNGF